VVVVVAAVAAAVVRYSECSSVKEVVFCTVVLSPRKITKNYEHILVKLLNEIGVEARKN